MRKKIAATLCAAGALMIGAAWAASAKPFEKAETPAGVDLSVMQEEPFFAADASGAETESSALWLEPDGIESDGAYLYEFEGSIAGEPKELAVTLNGETVDHIYDGASGRLTVRVPVRLGTDGVEPLVNKIVLAGSIPAAGEAPFFTADAGDGITADIQWFCRETSAAEWTEMQESDRFEGGKYYRLLAGITGGTPFDDSVRVFAGETEMAVARSGDGSLTAESVWKVPGVDSTVYYDGTVGVNVTKDGSYRFLFVRFDEKGRFIDTEIVSKTLPAGASAFASPVVLESGDKIILTTDSLMPVCEAITAD